MEYIEIQKDASAKTLPLKLQAYERLILFFERVSVPAMIARLKSKKMSSGDLQSALMVTVQKEYEHNVTQQLYVSDKLWEIVQLAKQEILNQLHQVMIEVAFTEDVDTYSDALIERFTTKGINPGQKAIHAIKQEAKLLLS
jgi:hypothetical protein